MQPSEIRLGSFTLNSLNLPVMPSNAVGMWLRQLYRRSVLHLSDLSIAPS
jgi:hypothetical protein